MIIRLRCIHVFCTLCSTCTCCTCDVTEYFMYMFGVWFFLVVSLPQVWVHLIIRLRCFALLSCISLYVWFGPASWTASVAQLVERLSRMQNIVVQVPPEAASLKMTVLDELHCVVFYFFKSLVVFIYMCISDSILGCRDCPSTLCTLRDFNNSLTEHNWLDYPCCLELWCTDVHVHYNDF